MSPSQKTLPEKVPAGGIAMAAIILSAMALLAIYANVQKVRRDKIETVTVVPAASPSPSSVPLGP